MANTPLLNITDPADTIRASMADPQTATSTTDDATRFIEKGDQLSRLGDDFYVSPNNVKINASTGVAELQTVKAADGVDDNDVATVGQIGGKSVGQGRLNASVYGGGWEDTTCRLGTDGSNNTVFTSDSGKSIVHESGSLYQVFNYENPTGSSRFCIAAGHMHGDEWLKIQPIASNKFTLPSLEIDDINSAKSAVTKEYVDKVAGHTANVTIPSGHHYEYRIDVTYAGFISIAGIHPTNASIHSALIYSVVGRWGDYTITPVASKQSADANLELSLLCDNILKVSNLGSTPIRTTISTSFATEA